MAPKQHNVPAAGPDAARLTRELIAFDTMPETGNEPACLGFLADLLRDAGFKTELAPFGEGRANLYAWLEDAPKKPGLCLAGHIDTVALHDGQWQSDPLCAVERDGRMFGRGTCDMKGGVAAMVCAAIRTRPLLAPGSDLRLHIYGGEEVGCLGSTHMVRNHPEQLSSIGAVIVTEPTSVLPSVGHKGALWLKVTAKGRAAHGSMPQFGDNALSKAIIVATKLESLPIGKSTHPQMGASTLALTSLHSGSSHNSVPDTASFTVDIRTVPGQDVDTLINEIKALAGEDCSVDTIRCIHSLWTDPAHPWVRRVAELTAPPDQIAQPAITQFFTDGAALRLANAEIPIVILGPGDPCVAHQTNEWCQVEQLYKAADVYARIIQDWHN